MVDELPIVNVPDTPLWSENYAFAVGNAGPDLGLMYSIGRWHSDPEIWREVMGVNLPDGRMVYMRNYGRNPYDDGPSASLSRLQVIEPHKTLRLTFDGPVRESTEAAFLSVGATESPLQHCTVDLTFEALHPVWDMNMNGDSAAASRLAGALHAEQIGRVTGTVEYGGETFVLDDAYGSRDHSRGPRDFSVYKRHAWLNGTFPSGLAFHLYGMELQDPTLPVMSNGVVLLDGTWEPAEIAVLGLLEKPADAHTPFVIEVTAAGKKIRIQVRSMLTIVPMMVSTPYDLSIGSPFAGGAAYLADQFLTFECDGEIGRGWSDRGVMIPKGVAIAD